MLQLSDEQLAELSAAIAAVGELGAMAEAVGDLYRRVQAEIDLRRPRCDISGRCCRFEEYGHRLFVTTIELAVFAQQLGRSAGSDTVGLGDVANWAGQGCPFQVKGLCGVHTIRPFGCRAYFCDPTATEWMNELYERFHAELKSLHERFAVPYFYVEWRQGLRATGVRPRG